MNIDTTFNKTSNQFEYPQTPSRVQLSIWPGGLATNAKGTVDWAGGEIDWDSEEIKKKGYYFATFSDVEIDCYQTNSAPGTNKGVSYYYNNARGTNDTVVDSNKRTVLKSLDGTGTDMDKDDSKSNPSGSPANNVPGGSVLNPGNDHPNADGTTNPSPGNGGGGGGSGSGSSPPCKATGFSQKCSDSEGGTNNQNNGVRGAERTLGASAFAVVIGFVGLLFL